LKLIFDWILRRTGEPRRTLLILAAKVMGAT